MAHPTFARSLSFAALTLAWVAWAPTASAQLKLPRRPAEPVGSRPSGDMAPHMVCLVCSERTYTARIDGRKDENGRDLVWCGTCKRDTAHRSNVNTNPGIEQGGGNREGDLRLPRRPPTPPPADPNAPPAPAVGGPGPVDPAPGAGDAGAAAPANPTNPAPTGASPAEGNPTGTAPEAWPLAPGTSAPTASGNQGYEARAVFTGLAKTKSVDDPAVARAIDRLSAIGEAGYAAAREELRSEDAVRMFVAAHVLLRSSQDADLVALEARLATKLPSGTASLVSDVARRDPVRAGPEWLAGLLDHPQGGVRQVAARELARANGPELLPHLEKAAASKRADTRQHAVELARSIRDPRATELLLARLDDPAPRVASSAVQALVASEEAGLDPRLLSIAFRERWVLRRGAYALVAIVEREDARLVPVLTAQHVEPLLAALSANDAFVAGTAATALAGIGFRSSDPRHAEWMDRAVPDRLVMTVSGKEFHDDLSSLTNASLRRLRVLSGQTLAADGPRWVEWWIGAREAFHARRAALPIEPADVAGIVVRCSSSGPEPEAFALVGPEAADGAESAIDAGEILYLNQAEATDLVAVLTREGLTAAEKLPGRRGGGARGERTLEIQSRGRVKTFTFGLELRETWFDRALDACRALRDQNRWQRFVVGGRHAGALDLWREQHDWWSVARSDAERFERLKGLVLTSLRTGSPSQRDVCVTELERLARASIAWTPADFDALVAAVRAESGGNDRGRRLARVALAAGSAGPDGLPDDAARTLAAACSTLPGALAVEALDEVFRAARRECVRGLAGDPHPALRGAAARALARTPEPEDVAVLMKLLADKDSLVETSAVLALGENKVEAARDELLVRARMGFPAVRTAALEAVGRLGGDYVLEALIASISDRDPAVRLAAARGLAALADPAASQVLISALGETSDSDLFDAARAGLVSMGEKAWPDLVRAVNQPLGRIRREAALILAEQSHPDAVSPLIAILTTTPKDVRVANELAVLTCIDLRSQSDPARAWWDWWDGVRHDDAGLWFRAALERAGVAPPPPAALEGAGTAQGRAFLVSILAREEAWLVERARRELNRLLDRDVGPLPPPGSERDAFLRGLRESLGKDVSRG